MFGRKVFGTKKPTVDEPTRPETPPQGQIFNKELFEGEMGDFLRKHGYAPDDPRNQAVNVQPLSVLLAEDQRMMRLATEAVNAVSNHPIVPVHFLPPSLWHLGAGPWLRQHLDLSPYRPWNTIFLPNDERGAAALDLPVAPAGDPGPEQMDQARAILSCIHDDFAGKDAPDVAATLILLKSIRENHAWAVPPERADFSGRVRDARTNVRAFAFLYASICGGLTNETIRKSHATFLERPAEQLIA